MSLNDGSPTMTMPVAPTGMTGGGWGGFGGDNGWWIIILFLAIFCGWGGNGNGFGNRSGGAGVVDGYVLTSDFANIERKLDGVNNGICDGFYAMNTGMLNGFAGVTQAVTSGFSQAELSRCNQQAALMTDTCVCCGAPVPEGRMVCPQCEYANERAVPGRKENKMDDGIQALVAEINARSKSNTHRIDDLEADNKALHQLATSVEVLATKQETIEANVTEIKEDVKSLKALPAGRWEGFVKALVSALVGGLVAYALFRLGLGE